MVQVYTADHNGRIPTKVRVMGARWFGGTWRVRYRLVQGQDSPYGKFTATHSGKRITFDGAS